MWKTNKKSNLYWMVQVWEIQKKHAKVESLSCGEVEALGYFQLSDKRYNDINMVTEGVSTTVLHLHLIWAPAQILEHVIELRRRI